MKRRSFLAALLSAPVAIKAGSKLPVLLTQTPQAALERVARTEFRNNEWRVYDKDGVLRFRIGVF